jgi:hypothetical protein
MRYLKILPVSLVPSAPGAPKRMKTNKNTVLSENITGFSSQTENSSGKRTKRRRITG